MAAPTLSAATITQESGKFSWTDINFDYGVSIKELGNYTGNTKCTFDSSTNIITMDGGNNAMLGAFYEIDITVPFNFTGLKGNITLNKIKSDKKLDNYYYPTDLTTWNQSYHEIFVNENYGGMITGSNYQIIGNSAGYSSGTVLNSAVTSQDSITQTYTETTGMKPTNIIRVRVYQDEANQWSLSVSDFNIQALPDFSFPIVQMAYSATIADNTNVNVDDFSLKIHGETTSIGKVLIDSGNVLLLANIDKRSPLVTNSPILSSALVSGSGGTVSTLATGLSLPYEITVVGTTVYFCEVNTNLIKKVTSDGTMTTFAGSGTSATTDGTGTAAAFVEPYGITNDGTNLYVASSGSHVIRKIVIATAVVTTFAGTAGTSGYTDATGTSAKFYNPKSIICDNAGENLYVADQSNYRIRKIVISTGVVTTLAGSGVNGNSDGTGTAAQFSFAKGITIDSTDTNVYVLANTKMRKIVVSTGVVTTLATITNARKGLTIDNSDEYLYFTRDSNHIITRLKLSDNSVTTFAGADGSSGNTNGSLEDARFNNPSVTFIDSNNILYVTENGNLRKIIYNIEAIELTFNNNIKDVSTYNAEDFVVTDGTTTVTITPSVASNKLVLGCAHDFTNLTNVRIIYTRHATANRNLLYTDDTAIESFDLLLDNNLSAANRNKAIEVTYTKHDTASRNIADTSNNPVASFTQNNDNTSSPTLSSMTIGSEGNRMGGWRKLDYSGGVTITELANYTGSSVCTFDSTEKTITMNGSTTDMFGSFYQIDITVPYKITGLRGHLSVQSENSTQKADDYQYPEDLSTWVQSYHEINPNSLGSWLVGTDKQIIARVGGTNGSSILNNPSKGSGSATIPYKIPILLKYVQTTGMTATNVVRIQVYQNTKRHWSIQDLQLDVLPDTNIKLVELNFSDTVYFGSNTKKDIFSVKRGNDSVKIIEAKSIGSKIVLLTYGEFTDVSQVNVEYYNDKFVSIDANTNNLDITFSNNILITDDIDNDIILKTSSGNQINVDASISSGKLSLTKKGNIDLTSEKSPLRSNFAYSHSTSTTITYEDFKVYKSFDVTNFTHGYYTGDSEYNSSDGSYAGSSVTNGYSGQWFQIDVGIPTIVKKIEIYMNRSHAMYMKDFRIFGSSDNSTFTQLLDVTNRKNERNFYKYNISGASSSRYYRIAVNKNFGGDTRLWHEGYFKFIGIPDSSVSFSDTNYTVEYNQSSINKLVRNSDINVPIPSFKIINGVDNIFQIKNLNGNTISSFTKNNGDSSSPSCSSVSIGNNNSRMGGWRKLDYSGGVAITELANYTGSSVCTFDSTEKTITMNGSTTDMFGSFYQIDITVPYKITGLRGHLVVQSENSTQKADDYHYPEDLSTWVQSYHEINPNSLGSWLVGTDKQIIARVGGTNGSSILNNPSKGSGSATIPYKIPILLKYVQTTGMTATNVVRIQVYQNTKRHWSIQDLQLDVLPDTNIKLVELNFSSNIALSSSTKTDIFSVKRGGEKINILDIKESTSKTLLLTDRLFEHADEIDIQYYQDKVSNVTVDSNNLQLTFNNAVTCKSYLNHSDFKITNFDGIVIPVNTTISSGKLVISKENLNQTQYVDLSSPDSIFKNDFYYDASSINTTPNLPEYHPDGVFDSNSSTVWLSNPDDYSGTDGLYAGTVTTNSYGGQWVQIDIGRQVTVKKIAWKIGSNAVYPKVFKIFGSNNNSSWTGIIEINHTVGTLTEQEKLISNSNSYRYYRIVINKMQSTNGAVSINFSQYVKLLGIPESNTFTDTNYTIEYNKSNIYDENLLRNNNPTIAVPSFKFIGTTDFTSMISNYRGTSVSSFDKNSGDSTAPSFHSAAIVNENSKFGWQSVTLETPTITIVEKTDNETMVWDNTDKTATMSGSTSSAFGSVIQLDFTAPCYFVGLRGQFKIESLTTTKVDDYYYPEILSTWNQAKTAISPNNNYGANLLGSDKQIIGRVGGSNGSYVLNNPSKGNGVATIPYKIPILLKYVQTTGMTETNIIRIKIYQDSRNHYKLSDFQLEVLPTTTYKIVELNFTENMINKDFDTTDFDIKGIGEIGQISKMKAESGKVYLLPSVRVPVLNSLNLRYRGNTVSSISIVAGNLDITFSNYVTVSGSLNSEYFVVKDSNGYNNPVNPTINSNKLRLTKIPTVNFSHDTSFNRTYISSSVIQETTNGTYDAIKAFDSNSITSSGWASFSHYSSGTYNNTESTSSYNGEWIQIDIGTSVVLNNLKISPVTNNDTLHPKSMRLFYSSNGTSWTQAADWTNLTLADDWKPSGSYAKVTKTGLAVTGRYFRLVVNEVLGGTYVYIGEIELYGYVGSTSFTSTDGTIIYTKSMIPSENILNDSDSSQAVGSFTLFNGSEDLTGHLTDVAGNTQPAFNVLSSDSTTPTISSISLSGSNLTLVFSEDIYEKDTYNTADFDVQLSGETMSINSLSINSGDIVLALGATPSSNNALRIVYTKHATSNRNIVDSAGNPVASFTHIPSNDSAPPTFTGMSLGGVHTGTGVIESVIAKSESDYAPNYSSIALVSGNIELTFTSNVSNIGDTSNYTVKEGSTVKLPSFSISNGKLVITPSYNTDVTAYDIASSSSSVSGQTYTSSSKLSDGYAVAGAFDNSTGAWISNNIYSSGAYTGSESTEGYDGEWMQVDIGQNVLVTSYEIIPRGSSANSHPANMRLFYSSNGTNWTQLRDWTGLTMDNDWRPSGTSTSQGPYTTSTIGRYFRLVINRNGGSYAWVMVGELKLLGALHTSETSISTFSLSNLIIDYVKGSGTDNLRDSNGFDVPSFEITNGTNTTGVVPTYASIATASNNIEVTFNQTLVDPGSLNKDDFHVTYNGSVSTISNPTISGDKLVISGTTNFTSTSNLIVDYIKHHSTSARRLKNADGDEVDSFEITNGVLTNNQTKPTFSSVAVVSGKLELTFSENIEAAGTMNKEDFSITGVTVILKTPTISSGKLVLERDEYSLNGVTPYDLVSTSSSLSGQTYSTSSTYRSSYPVSKAFDGSNTGDNDFYTSADVYSSGNYTGSNSTEGYSGEWIQVDVGQNVIMTSYETYRVPYAHNNAPKDMRLFSSSDGTNWTQVADHVGVSYSSDTSIVGNSNLTVIGRYFRLVVNKTQIYMLKMGKFVIKGITISQGSQLSFTDTNITIKYTKNAEISRHLIRVNDPSEPVDSFTVTNGTDTTPAVDTPKDGILIDLDQNISPSSGYANSNFTVTEDTVNKSIRAVKITPDNKVFLSMLTNINSISNTNITYTPSDTPSENLETTGGVKTLGFTVTNGSDVTTITNDRLVMNFSEDIVSKTTYSPDDFVISEMMPKTSTTTFSSIAVVNSKLELTFNNNVTVTGSLNKSDFDVKLNGNSLTFDTPTINNGKVIISSSAYNASGTSIDIASSTSSLSGTRTYTNSTNWGSSYAASKAFDNNNNNGWCSTGGTYNSGTHNGSGSTGSYDGEWVQVDVGTNVVLTSYYIFARNSETTANPAEMRFFSSTDGTNWTQIRDWTGLTNANDWRVGGTNTKLGPYEAGDVYGRYFRIAVKKCLGTSFTQIGELNLMGFAQSSEPSMLFTSTNHEILYTKHATASRNIVKAGATTDAIDTFRILNGSEIGLVKQVAEVAVSSGDVQLKTPIKFDNQTSIDIASSTSALTGSRTYTRSTQWNGDFSPSRAFDNNNTPYYSWRSTGRYNNSSGAYTGSESTEGYNGEWIQVDVGTTVVLKSYEIYPRGNTDITNATKMRFFSSINGTDWTQIKDWTGLTLANDWKPSGTYTSVGPYTTNIYGRYFRLVINELIAGTACQIGEIKLLGYAATSDAAFGTDIGNFEIIYNNPGVQSRNLVDLAGNVVQTFTGRSRPSYKSGTLTTTRIAEVTFTVALKDMTPLKSDFDVKLNGTSTSIESVSISGGKLIINLSKTMTPHSDSDPQVLTINYNKNSSATYNIRDAGDSVVESFTGKSITNPTSDTEPPIFVGAEIFDDEPTKIVLNFDFAVTISSPNVSTFSVKVNGSVVTISSVAISGGDVVLTLENAVSNTDTITVSYTKDDSDATKNIKDTNNNVLETPLRSEHGTIAVKVVNEGSGNKYTLEGVSQKTISLVKGFTYEFDTSDTSVSGHPFKLSTTSNGSHASGSEYTTGITHSGTVGSSGAKTTFVVPNGAPATLYYYCGNHSGMGGTINIHSDSFTSVVNSVVATAIKSFKNDIQAGGTRDGIVAKRWSRFREDKAVLTTSQRKYYGKDYFRTNPSAKIFKIIDEYNGQSIAFLKPSTSGDPGTAQAIDLDSDEAEIAFDNTSAEQSSLISFTFDPLRNDNTTNTITVKFLFVKRITGTTAKFTYTLDGYSGAGNYENKIVLTPAFSGGGTTGLITVTNMNSDTEQTLTCDVTIEYSPSVGSTLEYTKSFTFFGRNPAGGFSNDNSSTAGDPYIKTIRGVFYKLRDIPHKSVILYDNSNSDRRIQVHGYLEPNVNYKKQVEEFDDSLVSQLGERPINPSFFSKLWIRNKNQEYLIDLETWTELKTGKNIIDLFKVDFAIETCKFNVYLSEKCVTVKLPIDGNFYIIIKRFMNPEIRTGIELSIPTWMSSPLAYGALLYPGETNDLFIDKLDDKTLKRKARGLKNMTTVRENFANPETGSVKVVDWKY